MVEKKNPLSMFVRYVEASVVVATTAPNEFVERSAFGIVVIAKEVVVAFVTLELAAVTEPAKVALPVAVILLAEEKNCRSPDELP